LDRDIKKLYDSSQVVKYFAIVHWKKMSISGGRKKMKRGYYLEHWKEWSLPVMSVPRELNPLQAQGVHLSLALTCHFPLESTKSATVAGLVSGAEDMGMFRDVDTLIEATSGNTGIALTAMVKHLKSPRGKAMRVKLVVDPRVPVGKRYPLILAGAEIISPQEGMTAIATARKQGGGGWRATEWQADNGCLNLDQYGNPAGTALHTAFTAPKILEQLRYRPTVFVAGIGTGGTLIGVSRHLRQNLEKIMVVGVICAPGQEIPGCRDLNGLEEIRLPWRESLDEIVEIPTQPSYHAAFWFNRILGITPGPSSGFAYLGALKFLYKHKRAGTLDSLRDDRGRIHAVILFPDGNRSYGERFLANLSPDYIRVSTALPWKIPRYEIV
jgi:cysteine synthase B